MDSFVIWFWILAALYVLSPFIFLPLMKPSKHAELFDRESRRQMGRIDLNERRSEQGLPPIAEPRYLHPDSEDAKLLKRMNLWPEAPAGYGGVWFNEPWTRHRRVKPNQIPPRVIGLEETYWRFDPKKYNAN